MVVNFALVDYRLSEVLVLERVGIELGLKAESRSLFNGLAALAVGCGAVEEVACIELNTGQVGINLHCSAAVCTI